MAQRDVNNISLAKQIGVSHPVIGNFLAGQSPKSEQLAALADFFNVSMDWLVGRDSRFDRVAIDKLVFAVRTDSKTAFACPIISWASAGERHEYEDQGEGGARIATDCQDVNCYALTLEGDSMSPIYMHGDVLVAAPNQEAQHGDLVVAKTLRDEVYYKRLEYSRDMKTIRLVSLNPNYPVMEFWMAELRFLHPVFSITRYPQQKFNH